MVQMKPKELEQIVDILSESLKEYIDQEIKKEVNKEMKKYIPVVYRMLLKKTGNLQTTESIIKERLQQKFGLGNRLNKPLAIPRTLTEDDIMPMPQQTMQQPQQQIIKRDFNAVAGAIASGDPTISGNQYPETELEIMDYTNLIKKVDSHEKAK